MLKEFSVDSKHNKNIFDCYQLCKECLPQLHRLQIVRSVGSSCIVSGWNTGKICVVALRDVPCLATIADNLESAIPEPYRGSDGFITELAIGTKIMDSVGKLILAVQDVIDFCEAVGPKVGKSAFTLNIRLPYTTDEKEIFESNVALVRMFQWNPFLQFDGTVISPLHIEVTEDNLLSVAPISGDALKVSRIIRNLFMLIAKSVDIRESLVIMRTMRADLNKHGINEDKPDVFNVSESTFIEKAVQELEKEISTLVDDAARVRAVRAMEDFVELFEKGMSLSILFESEEREEEK